MSVMDDNSESRSSREKEGVRGSLIADRAESTRETRSERDCPSWRRILQLLPHLLRLALLLLDIRLLVLLNHQPDLPTTLRLPLLSLPRLLHLHSGRCLGDYRAWFWGQSHQ